MYSTPDLGSQRSELQNLSGTNHYCTFLFIFGQWVANFTTTHVLSAILLTVPWISASSICKSSDYFDMQRRTAAMSYTRSTFRAEYGKDVSLVEKKKGQSRPKIGEERPK